MKKFSSNLSAKVRTLEKYVTMDFNGDGVVNIQDVADIQRKTVKKKYNYANDIYPVNYVSDKVIVIIFLNSFFIISPYFFITQLYHILTFFK